MLFFFFRILSAADSFTDKVMQGARHRGSPSEGISESELRCERKLPELRIWFSATKLSDEEAYSKGRLSCRLSSREDNHARSNRNIFLPSSIVRVLLQQLPSRGRCRFQACMCHLTARSPSRISLVYAVLRGYGMR